MKEEHSSAGVTASSARLQESPRRGKPIAKSEKLSTTTTV